MHILKLNGETHVIDGNDELNAKELCFFAQVSPSYLNAMKRAGFVMHKRPGQRSHVATYNAYLLFHRNHPHFRS
jgi:hypothetical protein